MEEISKTLSKLGLTQYEIDVYLALVKYGTQGAVDLTKTSGVPFGRIYDVLYQLELKGFVKVILGKPKTFSPVEPKEALKITLKKRKEKLIELEREVDKEANKLSIIYHSTVESKEPAIWIARGRENILGMRMKQISKAKKEIFGFISPDVTTGPIYALERIVSNKIREGVKVRWIENPQTQEVLDKIKTKIKTGAEVKILPYKGFNMVILDEEQIHIEIKDELYGRTFIIIENSDLAGLMKEFFEFKWNQAKEIKV